MRIDAGIRRSTVYVVVALLIFSAAFFAFGMKNDENGSVSYSTYNAGPKGLKALFLLSGEMGFNPKQYRKSSRFLPVDSTLVAVFPDSLYFNDSIERKYLLNWLEKGNTLILVGNNELYDTYGLDEMNLELVQVSIDSSSHPLYIEYSSGKGSLFFVDNYTSFTNESLKSYDSGILFIHLLEKAGHNTVLFNEYYHGIPEKGSFLWDILGPAGKLLLIQIALALIVFMFVKSRRFGKPAPVYETIKRTENENLYALSNIYLKNRANTLVLETCFNSFKRQLSEFLGLEYAVEDSELIMAANSNRFLRGKNIEELLDACENYIINDSESTKKMLNLAIEMEKIRKGII